jgi:hypothetical protein
MAKQNAKKSDKMSSGLFIPAGLFLGIGVGLILSQPGIGALIGLGLGFLTMAIVKMIHCC